jgi:hypothetical protein
VHRSCPPIFVYFTDAAGMQEKAIVCGNQVGILAFARLGNFSLVAVVRRRRGGKGIRTPGLLIANETLYQLSYTPVYVSTKCIKRALVQAALTMELLAQSEYPLGNSRNNYLVAERPKI